jgi:K+-transporting ATPase ATPase C chain
MHHLRPAAVLLALLTLLTGAIYPALVTVIARVMLPANAGGSLSSRDGVPVGSRLLGQPFADPAYFWSRPSATTPPWNAAASGASNSGPSSASLHAAIAARAARLRDADPGNAAPIPQDLVTASGSGLDPHLSPAAIRYQLDRVARARGCSREELEALVAECVEPPLLSCVGAARIEVLTLNLRLDERFPAAPYNR